jgi:hypothetical protein
LANHRLWIWDLLRLIRYCRNPYSVFISLTLNHILWLRSILIYSFGWVVDYISLHGDHRLWRPLVHTSHCTTSCGRKDLCPVGLSSIIRNHLSNIKLQYGVFLSPTYSCPFSRLFSICFLIIYQFASECNYRYKLRVTIRFILFHNSSSPEFVIHFVVLRALTT